MKRESSVGGRVGEEGGRVELGGTATEREIASDGGVELMENEEHDFEAIGEKGNKKQKQTYGNQEIQKIKQEEKKLYKLQSLTNHRC